MAGHSSNQRQTSKRWRPSPRRSTRRCPGRRQLQRRCRRVPMAARPGGGAHRRGLRDCAVYERTDRNGFGSKIRSAIVAAVALQGMPLMQYEIEVGGKRRQVVVAREGDGFAVTVDGATK